jgi:curved DNA-binding protein CbpA
MGFDEAQEVLQGRGPRGILGVPMTATWNEIKHAYKKLVVQYHPDRAGDEGLVKIKEINAAYAVLAHDFRK